MTLIKGDSMRARAATPFRSGRARGPDIAPLAEKTVEAAAEAQEDLAAAELQRLSRRIAELEIALTAAATEQERATAAALARGKEEGLAAAQSADAERLSMLREAVGEAIGRIESRFAEERDIAIEIAHSALDRIFADTTQYRPMVVETARRNAAKLMRGTILGLRVSATDFPDADSLTALPALGIGIKVEADPSLGPGACIFDLTLGTLDASIPNQVAVVEQLFEQIERAADRRAASA